MELMKPRQIENPTANNDVEKLLEPFIKNKEEYIWQIKYDGGSSKIDKTENSINIFHGDNPNRQNVKYPELMQEFKEQKNCEYIVELCVFDENGVSVLNKYQKRCHTDNKIKIEYFLKDAFPVVAIVHDVTKIGDTDVTRWTYIDRLKFLKENLIETPHIKLIESFDNPFEIINRQKKLMAMEKCVNFIEGIVLKKKTSPYLFGKRDEWWKVRWNKEETVKCITFEDTQTGIVLITEDGRRINYAGDEKSREAKQIIIEEGCVIVELVYHMKTPTGYRDASEVEIKRVKHK
jgi:ATP-dependent DNA ligase